MIIWTGGSFLMRAQIGPSNKFWYDVSIFGLLFLCFALYNFVYAFTDSHAPVQKTFWFVSALTVNIINITTGVFLAAPNLVSANGRSKFIYEIKWPVVVLFGICVLMVADMLIMLFRNFKVQKLTFKQFAPILTGMAILLLGHIAFVLPIFSGFPIDIISGVLNAICLLYALYSSRLFNLKLLASKGSTYAISSGLTVLIFIQSLGTIESFLGKKSNIFSQYKTVFTAVVFAIIASVLYLLIKKFFDRVFIAEEHTQAEYLSEYSSMAARSLNLDEILGGLVDIIKKGVKVPRVYIALPGDADLATGNNKYVMVHSTSPLDDKSFVFESDSPIIGKLSDKDEYIIMSEFKRTTAYKAMWDREKRALDELNVACVVPLKDQDELVGIVMLSHKHGNKTFSYNDVNFLKSADSIASIAIKNSKMYEKAYWEARTDELTGLLNRKYFFEQLHREEQRCQEQGLALIIISLDDFKLYNQLYGIKEGDRALKEVALILKSSVGTNGYLARHWSKEFAVILPGYDMLTAKKVAVDIKEKIHIMNERSVDHAFKRLTASIGICSMPCAAGNIKQLIENTEFAVHQVKRNGKNNIMCCTEEHSLQPKGIARRVTDKKRIYSEYEGTIFALTAAIDTKDHYTFNHSNNVAAYAEALARAARLSPDHVELIREAGLLHDIGKIGVAEHILNKPGKLTDEEFDAMKLHVENSIGIIKHLPSLDYVIPSVIGHHERYDGRGYPRKLKGEEIPLGGRILCIADAFDAMTTTRSYKPSYTVEHALKEIERCAGAQFDPNLAPLFVNIVEKGILIVPTDKSEQENKETPSTTQEVS